MTKVLVWVGLDAQLDDLTNVSSHLANLRLEIVVLNEVHLSDL